MLLLEYVTFLTILATEHAPNMKAPRILATGHAPNMKAPGILATGHAPNMKLQEYLLQDIYLTFLGMLVFWIRLALSLGFLVVATLCN